MKDILTLNVACLNLRWLLLSRESHPSQWAEFLEKFTRKSISRRRSNALLEGNSSLNEAESLVIAEMFSVDAEELHSVPLYARDNSVFESNINFLLDAIPRGQRKAAAKMIGVKEQQLSRWKNLVVRPRVAHLRSFLRFHGIDPDLDLEKQPLFLSMEPISGFGQKRWLQSRIEQMSAMDVGLMFPALKKLLKPSEED